MKLSDVTMRGAKALREAGIEGAMRDARLLVADVVGLAPSRITLEADMDVGGEKISQFQEYIARRIHHEPVSRILGRRLFWGREFAITPDVLDPRGDTETLIAEALSYDPPARLLDLGTGSGAIAVTLLGEWPEARAVATDLSPAALAVAAQNGERHGVMARLEVRKSDWFEAVHGKYDLILSNPPYISEVEMADLAPEVMGYDPHMALTPGGDGLAPYRAVARGAGAHLTPNGRVIVEIGHSQAADVEQIFRDNGFVALRRLQDLEGKDRVVTARLP